MIKYIIQQILTEARRRGLKDELSWSDYNRILYGVMFDISREISDHYKKKGK